ncbi:GGDEF domain-containing protein [Deinococcus sp. SM5_A1]|uniref:GGDEF domain-containing protein n=1 Tax=Deinococcus sp. SM5_A1 TaxID=3379094 RepID=UPI00385E923E
MRSPPDHSPVQANPQHAQTRRQPVDPVRLLLWVPLLAAAIGLIILVTLHVAALPYVGLLMFVMVYSSLALFGPRSTRTPLLMHAAQVYAVTLLVTWITALYLLPGHPATSMVSLAVLLHLTTVYVFLFVQQSPQTATHWAAGTLSALVITALPHTWQTLEQTGIVDGVTLPVTLLVSHGALITVLRSFSTFRDWAAHSEGRAQALHELAHCDPLTGLPNRRALERDLERVVAVSGAGQRLAVVDVDGLKGVNDRLGHAAGDDLLRRFAKGFTEQIGEYGQAYRIGGDEFALLMSDEQPSAEAMIGVVTRHIRAMYLEAAASVGTAHWRPGETADAWLARADAALYRHKRRGGPGR